MYCTASTLDAHAGCFLVLPPDSLSRSSVSAENVCGAVAPMSFLFVKKSERFVFHFPVYFSQCWNHNRVHEYMCYAVAAQGEYIDEEIPSVRPYSSWDKVL